MVVRVLRQSASCGAKVKKLQIINLLAGILVLALLGVAGSQLQKLISQTPAQAVVSMANDECDLGKNICITKKNSKVINLHFSSPVKYLEKFDIGLAIQGFSEESLQQVYVEFDMQGMNMGINRFELHKQSDKRVWEGFAILPVCVSGRKNWQVKLHIFGDNTHYVVMHKLIIQN